MRPSVPAGQDEAGQGPLGTTGGQAKAGGHQGFTPHRPREYDWLPTLLSLGHQ